MPIVDFTKVFLPKLKHLSLFCQGLESLDFTTKNTPLLNFINVEQPGDEPLEYINLDLPNLTQLRMQFVDFCDSQGFGNSISSCPKIESVFFYKVNGLYSFNPKKHELVLPSCEMFHFHRCEDLNSLDIWAPKLSILNFQACYGLEEVNMFDQKPTSYCGPDYEFTGEPEKYKVTRLYTGKPIGNAFDHSRCRSIFPKSDDIENHDLEEDEE